MASLRHVSNTAKRYRRIAVTVSCGLLGAVIFAALLLSIGWRHSRTFLEIAVLSAALGGGLGSIAGCLLAFASEDLLE